MKTQKTALLIFANSAEKEITSKSFSSKTLFETLNAQTLHIAKQTGLPYFHYTETQQIGYTFGERFTNAIQSVYNKGFDTVITIGNDTPHLTSKHIAKAVENLKTHDTVLGLSTDGGFYLMGLKKHHFKADAFLKLPWQTSKLNRSFTKLITSKKLKLVVLEVLNDIDSLSDIETVLKTSKTLSSIIKTLLIGFLPLNKKIATRPTVNASVFVTPQYLNKGSPVYTSF